MTAEAPKVAAPQGGQPAAGTTDRLRPGSLGAAGITFFVIAAAAPLTCVIAITPLIIGFGAGLSAPLVYLAIGGILLLFAVGYVAMSRQVPNPGALYTYIAHGLGRSAGIGAAFVALISYVAALLTLSAFFGYSLSQLVLRVSGVEVSWVLCSAAMVVVLMLLGHREVSLGAKLLGVLLVSEVLILFVLAAVVIATGGATGLPAAPFDLRGLLVPGIGVSLAFAYASYIGFEQTAIYAEEAKSPASVKRATYAAIIITSLFYAFITYVVISAFGVGAVVGAATASPGTLVFDASGTYLGGVATAVMEVLVITSSVAACLSFHNATARYLYSLGREGILPAGLGRSHAVTGSPHRASIVVGALNAGLLGVFALAGVDPYLGVFTWGAASSTVGFVGIQAVCSLAIFAYFRRHAAQGEGLWTTVVAPLLAVAGLGLVLALVLQNFSSLIGYDVGAVALLVPLLYVAAGVVGAVWGAVLRRSSPAVWERIGRGAPQ